MKTLFDPDITLEEAEELINNGANVNQRNYDIETPLFYAINENIEIVRLLIKNGADVNAQDLFGCSVLFYALDEHTISLLIENGADINIMNSHGMTPLYYEVKFRNKSELVKRGALFRRIIYYLDHKNIFTQEQQNAFDSFLLLTNNDEDFFQMCLAYQNNKKYIEIKDMDII